MSGIYRLNSSLNLLRRINVIAVPDRPWNQKDRTTEAYKQLAESIVADIEIYPQDRNNKAPKASTIEALLKSVFKISRNVAEIYENVVLQTKIPRPAGRYSLLLSSTKGEVLEVGCIQSQVNMDEPFKLTKKEIAEVMRDGDEERNITRCNLLLAIEVLKIGLAELKNPEHTIVGQNVSIR
jgi:hypothetical protein